MSTSYRIEALDAHHDRKGFDCGVPVLDRYLRDLASQDVRRLVSKCFVACGGDTAEVAAFYTLAATEIPLGLLPEALARRLPRYASVPAVRVGRLAVDRRHRGRRLGAALIVNAESQVRRAEIGAFMLVVDAKDDAASAFYRHLGFSNIGSPQVLGLTLANTRKALK